MKTKLVYVLTCAPEANYIEQALMSVWSARHWNPDAHIVLITDNLTDQLFVGRRAEILDYISEKIVVPFEDDGLSMAYRSRWLKTRVRQLIAGNFLFIDCDTIVCKSLSDVDSFGCEVGAVPEAMLPIAEFCPSLLDMDVRRCADLGVDLLREEYYYCSGVIYVKDTPMAHKLYELWHEYCKQSFAMNMLADQPGLCKANVECNHLIQRIPDSYDVITFTQNGLYKTSHIMHISPYRNASFLGSKKLFAFLRNGGMGNTWVQKTVLHPESSFFPFDNELYSSSAKDRISWSCRISEYAEGYGEYIDASFSDLKISSRFHRFIHACFVRKRYRLGAWLWLTWRYCHLHFNHVDIKDNVCQR